MPLPVWSTSVPYRAMRGSWSMDTIPPSIDSEMEGANLRKRARPGGNYATISFTIRMTEAEWVARQTFIRTDLSNGTSRFTMSVWLGSSYIAKTVQFPAGFVPTATYRGLFILVAMKLRVYGV